MIVRQVTRRPRVYGYARSSGRKQETSCQVQQ
ncbi:unnamed protein product, partial [marine sediment metagenome]